jgi:hypothetical protein
MMAEHEAEVAHLVVNRKQRENLFSIIWGIYSGVELLGDMVILCSTFMKELENYFTNW